MIDPYKKIRMRTLSLVQSFVAFRSSFHQIYAPVTSQIFYQKKYFLQCHFRSLCRPHPEGILNVGDSIFFKASAVRRDLP